MRRAAALAALLAFSGCHYAPQDVIYIEKPSGEMRYYHGRLMEAYSTVEGVYVLREGQIVAMLPADSVVSFGYAALEGKRVR